MGGPRLEFLVTSPRMWKRSDRESDPVRGTHRERDSWRKPLTPTLSPQERGEESSHINPSGRSFSIPHAGQIVRALR